MTGVVKNSDDVVKWFLNGTWDNKLEVSKVYGVREDGKGKQVLETGSTKVIWKRRLPPSVLSKIDH